MTANNKHSSLIVESGSDDSSAPVCYELLFFVSELEKQAFSELLVELGVQNFVEGGLQLPEEMDVDPELIGQDFYTGLSSNNQEPNPITVYSEDLNYLQSLQADVLSCAQQHSLNLEFSQCVIKPIDDQNWRESWKKSFLPVGILNTFCIIPPWISPNSQKEPISIVINPGMAFGTGQHETTQVCLKLFLEHKDSLGLFSSVFDVGTGSGVLAIACEKWAKEFQMPFKLSKILGNDIDPDSVAIAVENALQNKCTLCSFTEKGTKELGLNEIPPETFDLLFANIQIGPLRKILPQLKDRFAPNAKIIISGILATEDSEFCDLLLQLKYKLIAKSQLNHWMGYLAELEK